MRCQAIERALLDALRLRGATEEELAPALALGFGNGLSGRARPAGYAYKPVFQDPGRVNDAWEGVKSGQVLIEDGRARVV